MTEKKRTKRRKDDYTGPGEQVVVKPSRDEYRVAKWMKKNIKTKKTKFLNHNVEYFSSNKAIDALLRSSFADEEKNPLFTTRDHVKDFLHTMLEHKFFHRAKKVPVTLEELRSKGSADTVSNKTSSSAATTSTSSTTTATTSGTITKKEKDTEGEAEASGTNGAEEAGVDDNKEKKKKRKIRLDMHPEQIFVDGSEAYVWIYDPIPIHYWIYGLILLLGAIGICLFPLWPQMLRNGVYYLSVAAAGFLVFILALAFVRLIIFVMIWIITGSKMHFWIFPNLTEDVGFFASFWPLYESKFNNEDGNESEKSKKSKSKKKDKDSDAEDDNAPDSVELEAEKIEDIKEHDADMELIHRKVRRDVDEELYHSSGAENSESAVETDAKGTPSESDSEISGKDYEIISTSEVQNVL